MPIHSKSNTTNTRYTNKYVHATRETALILTRQKMSSVIV